MSEVFKPHISKFKKSEVDEIKQLFKEYPVVAIVNLENLPALMLQRISHRLRDDMVLKVTKKRLIKIALEELKDKKNLAGLKDRLEGIPALMFSKEDPFILFKKIEKSKASAPAKPGQKAPNDLKIEAGPTPFTPGPMIGELGMLGIKTEVKDNKIHVKDEKILVKDGEVISEQVAGLLSKLGVEPMKVGLNVLLTYQDGEILEKAVLLVDEEAFIADLKQAHATAYSLALHLGIVNDATAQALMVKGEREAEAVNEKIGGTSAEEKDDKPEPKDETLAPVVEEEPKAEEKKPEAAPVVEEKPTEQPVEEKAPEPEVPKPAETPVEPEVKEEPTPVTEEKPAEAPEQKEATQAQETPVESALEQPEAKEIASEPTEETLVDASPEDMEKAQEVLHSIMGTPKPKATQVVAPAATTNEQDINKLINKLKDKKIRGDL